MIEIVSKYVFNRNSIPTNLFSTNFFTVRVARHLEAFSSFPLKSVKKIEQKKHIYII